MSSFKNNIYHLIDGEKGTHKNDAYVDIGISILIVLNVVSVVLESYKSISHDYRNWFYLFEAFSIVVFTIEYILRIWTADLKYPDDGPIKSRLKFIFSFIGLIDLIAILPFFLPLVFKMDLRIIRSLRLLRLLRMFKLGRHSSSLRLIGQVLKETRYDLLVTLFLTLILLVIASTLMFYLEHDAQPEAFDNIGQALWWAVATLTTVGYGDIYPVTGLGKLLSGLIALIGIGIVALPTGIISSAFVQKLADRKAEKELKKCPHCGKDVHKE